DKEDATQTQIRFGGISDARSDPDYVAATVANTILGGGFTSKLIEELRIKRSLTYSAFSMYSARLPGGDFRVSTCTETPPPADRLAVALEVVNGVRGARPDPKALVKAKTYLLGQLPLRIESPDALAARLAEMEFYGLPADDIATMPARIRAVTGDDVARVT